MLFIVVVVIANYEANQLEGWNNKERNRAAPTN